MVMCNAGDFHFFPAFFIVSFFREERKIAFYKHLFGQGVLLILDLIHCIKLKEMTEKNALLTHEAQYWTDNEIFMVIFRDDDTFSQISSLILFPPLSR
jgi:hypothetical protein